MNKILRVLVALTAVSAVLSGISCSKKKDENSSVSEIPEIAEETYAEYNEAEEDSGEDMFITWLGDYDLNPYGSDERSVALALYEDVYGGTINFMRTTDREKFETLDTLLASGFEIDMFPYSADVFPYGAVKNKFAPLDPYYKELGMDDFIWEDMKDVIDMFEYNGEHYVVPYSISNPLLITYSRTMIKENELDDPYTLYTDGKWNWNSFMNIMEAYKEKNPSGYGINGWFGQAMLQSTGHTVINCENGTFTNNINDPEIEKAEHLMQDIVSKGLYDSTYKACFPTDRNTLFYAMGDWALGASNARNPEADLMIVPFPKAPDADRYYTGCDFQARMLVNGSAKGKAVATYLKCERLAASEASYKETAKEQALAVKKATDTLVTSYVTEEQYDALQSYLNTRNFSPVFDFGCGMGEKMFSNGYYTYESRGVMNNITDAILEGHQFPAEPSEEDAPADYWKALRGEMSGIIDAEISAMS